MLQQTLFAPASNWRAPSSSEWPRFADAERICVDFECKDMELKKLGIGAMREGNYVAGIGLAIDKGPAVYLPLRHLGGDNVENPDAAWAWFRDNAAAFQGEYTGAHSSYDLIWGRVNGVLWPKAKCFWDVLILHNLVYELCKRAGLDDVCKYWKVPGKDKAKLIEASKAYGLKNPLAEMWKLPGRYVGEYNIADLRAPLALLPPILTKLSEMKCDQIRDIETELTPILVDMWMRGLRWDLDKAQDVETWCINEERAQADFIKHRTNLDVGVDNWNNNGLMSQVLLLDSACGSYREQRQMTKKGAGKVLLDDPMLKSLSGNVEKGEERNSANAVSRGRKVNKLRNTFLRQNYEHLSKDMRIRFSYNQVRGTDEDLSDDDGIEVESHGARTGRMSCDHVNMTQQPSREDFAPMWKETYIPEEGCEWQSADYSQQEPRLTTSYAAKLNLPKARETSAAYLSDELIDNHDFMAQLTDLPRKKAKNIYLGLVYSMGDAKLCHSLELPTRWCVAVGSWSDQKKHYFQEQYEALSFRTNDVKDELVRVFETSGPEGAAIIAKFHERAPFLKELSQLAMKNGRKYGEIITILGRHLHLPLKPDGGYDWVHACLNMLIQGSAADQMKKGMVDVVRWDPSIFLQVQVHDMLGWSARKDGREHEYAKAIGRVMRNTIQDPWMVYRVDVARGRSWGGEQEMCYDQHCTEYAISAKKKWCPAHAPKIAA